MKAVVIIRWLFYVREYLAKYGIQKYEVLWYNGFRFMNLEK